MSAGCSAFVASEDLDDSGAVLCRGCGNPHGPRPPWRFDVPEVPDSVTAFQDGDGEVWVRRADDPQLWSRWLGAEMMALVHAHREGSDSASATVAEVIALNGLPLVECADPRKAAT